MDEVKEVTDYYDNRNRLILLEEKLHNALYKVTEKEYWNSSGACNIHPAIAHPEWENLKERIYPTMMIWQIAYMVCPFRDAWETRNPFDRNSFFMERLKAMYEIIDAIECGYINNYQLPPEIENKNQLEVASLDSKVKIKIHFDDLANAIKNNGIIFWNSKWVRLWVAHTTRAKKPKLPFSAPPEPVHIQGIFNEKAFFREIEGKPFELHEVEAPEWTGIKQTYVDSFSLWQEKYRFRNIHPVFEDDAQWIEQNLNTSTIIEVQPMYMIGDERPQTYKLGEKPLEKNDVESLQNKKPTYEASDKLKPKPTSKLDLQAYSAIEIKKAIGSPTNHQLHAACKRQRNDLFSGDPNDKEAGWENFRKILRRVREIENAG